MEFGQMKKWLLGFLALPIALLFPQKAYALTDDTSLPVSDSSQFMSYYTGNDCSYAFNIKGMYNGESIQTTYSNAGYHVVIDVDGSRYEPQTIVNGRVFSYNGVDIRLRLMPTSDGRAIRILYDLENKTSAYRTVRIGSSADTQIGQNDHATVVFDANGIGMSDENERLRTYGAKFSLYYEEGTPFTTKWLGYYGNALANVFTDGTLTSYSLDSGIAWSWTVNLEPAGSPASSKTVGTQIKLDSMIEIGNTAIDIVPEASPQYLEFTVPFLFQRQKDVKLFYSFDTDPANTWRELATVCNTGDNEGGTFEKVIVDAANDLHWLPDSNHKLFLYAQDMTTGSTMKSRIMEYDIYWPHGVKYFASVLVNKDGKEWEGMAALVKLVDAATATEYDNNGADKLMTGTYRIFLNGADTGEALEIVDQNVVKVLDYYTVTFVPNDGTGTAASVNVSLKNTPLVFPTYTRGCYTFTGWNTAADASGIAIDPAAYPVVSGTLTAYAQWTEAHSFVLTYDANHPENGHWQECTSCHIKRNQDAHSFSLANDADCHWQVCNICGGKKEIEEHSFTLEHDASHHWKECSVCGELADEDEHVFELTHDKNSHWQECSVCHETASKEKHAFAQTVDADGHWQECSTCHEKKNYGVHEFKFQFNKTEHWLECESCHLKKNIAAHICETRFTETDHWKVCTDENCAFETEKERHSLTDWHTVIDANIEHEGKDGCECVECGYERYRKIPMVYVILEGANGEWKRGTTDVGLRFVANGKIENFAGILIDGREINPRLYKSKAGSTILELSPELLEGLKLGTHKIEVTYVDGSCSTLFKILKEDSPKVPTTNDSLTNIYVDLCTIFLFAGIVVFLIFVIRNERNRED